MAAVRVARRLVALMAADIVGYSRMVDAGRAAACGHLGRTEEAHRCAGWFLEAVRMVWRGDPAAGPAEYIDWLVDKACLRRPEDEAHLRDGLRLAGLPPVGGASGQ